MEKLLVNIASLPLGYRRIAQYLVFFSDIVFADAWRLTGLLLDPLHVGRDLRVLNRVLWLILEDHGLASHFLRIRLVLWAWIQRMILYILGKEIPLLVIVRDQAVPLLYIVEIHKFRHLGIGIAFDAKKFHRALFPAIYHLLHGDLLYPLQARLSQMLMGLIVQNVMKGLLINVFHNGTIFSFGRPKMRLCLLTEDLHRGLLVQSFG